MMIKKASACLQELFFYVICAEIWLVNKRVKSAFAAELEVLGIRKRVSRPKESGMYNGDMKKKGNG